jgi:hypothetical protein
MASPPSILTTISAGAGGWKPSEATQSGRLGCVAPWERPTINDIRAIFFERHRTRGIPTPPLQTQPVQPARDVFLIGRSITVRGRPDFLASGGSIRSRTRRGDVLWSARPCLVGRKVASLPALGSKRGRREPMQTNTNMLVGGDLEPPDAGARQGPRLIRLADATFGSSDVADARTRRPDFALARDATQYRDPGRSLRLTRPGARLRSIGQNHCAEVLDIGMRNY